MHGITWYSICITMCLFHRLIALKAMQCCSYESNDFVMRLITCMLEIRTYKNANMQVFTRIIGSKIF